jgi:hypothetical protein
VSTELTVSDCAPTESADREPPRAAANRVAFWVFVAGALAATVTYAVIGRHIWFWGGAAGDEWDFLATRHLTLHDLLEQHGGNPSVLPVVAYRALFVVFGLRSYRPYQFPAIALHIAAGCLLRALMRRAGVRPWIATAAAALFICFGAAGQDILWAFQIGYSGALVLGLTQLLCADHDGGIDRRDWIGVGFGLAALMCASVAIVTIGVVGIATLIRRGWRIALFHTAPLAVLYVAWERNYGSTIVTKDKTLVVRWVGRGIWGAFGDLAQVPPLGFVLAGVLVVGLALAWQSWDRHDRRRRASLPVAMLVGAVGFLALSGIARAWVGVQFATSSRYMHIVAALLLLPLAVAADELARRWRVLLPFVLVLFLVGIPGNISKTTGNFPRAAYFDTYRQMLFSLPRMPIARDVPLDLRPEPNQAPQITMRWLLAGAGSGWLPSPRPSTPREFATNTLRLSLEELDRGVARKCAALSAPSERTLATGDSLIVYGRLLIQLLPPTTPVKSAPVQFGDSALGPKGPHTLVAVVQPLTLRITPQSKGASVC